MFFPAHVLPAKILEMASYCINVTHLSLPRSTQLSLNELEVIVHVMTHLQQLDVFVDRKFMQREPRHDSFECLLQLTATSVRE